MLDLRTLSCFSLVKIISGGHTTISVGTRQVWSSMGTTGLLIWKSSELKSELGLSIVIEHPFLWVAKCRLKKKTLIGSSPGRSSLRRHGYLIKIVLSGLRNVWVQHQISYLVKYSFPKPDHYPENLILISKLAITNGVNKLSHLFKIIIFSRISGINLKITYQGEISLESNKY